jgi:integrase
VTELARRLNSEGTVVKRKDGRWAGAVTIDWANGKQRRRWVYGKSAADVLEKIDELRKNQRDGIHIEPSKSTVGDWLNVWLYEYAKPSVRETAWTSYESVVRVHLITGLGAIVLNKLQPAQVQRFLNAKARDGYNATTIGHMLVILKMALKQAVVDRLLVFSPAEGTRPPKKQQAEARALTVDQQAQLMTVLGTERLGPLIAFALGTGMRHGELLALRWSEVDLGAGVVSVQRTTNRVKAGDGDAKTRVIIGSPKTAKGRRRIPMPDGVRRVLQQWRVTQTQERLAAGPAWHDTGLVWTTAVGKPLSTGIPNLLLDRLAARAGIGHVKLHELRHTYATRLMEAGVDARTVQEMMGHANVAMTLGRYSHVMPERKQSAAAALNGLFASL